MRADNMEYHIELDLTNLKKLETRIVVTTEELNSMRTRSDVEKLNTKEDIRERILRRIARLDRELANVRNQIKSKEDQLWKIRIEI